MHILVTGGTGFLGSHTVVELLDRGHSVTVLDSLVNSSPVVLDRIEELTGHRPRFLQLDLRDRDGLDQALRPDGTRGPVDAVLHFAGLKAVGESVGDPLSYWEVNVAGTINLLRAMGRAGVRDFVFSSSATVYDADGTPPFDENAPTAPGSPYGRTKLAVEQLLRDLCGSEAGWSVAILRYFNPVGAHPSGRIGEDPRDVPNNLMPFVTQVAVGKRPELQVFGNDYPTVDGTGVRDYIHVVDLARGHLAALDRLSASRGLSVYNLGTGRGTSVLELLSAFERASGRPIPYRIAPRRPGDSAAVWASVEAVREDLAWEAEYDVHAMCRDAWNWQRGNPAGYDDDPCG